MFSKYWKKIISMVLVLALLVQITTIAVQAEETYPTDLECDPQTGLSILYEHTPFDIWYAGTAYVNTYLGTLHLRRSDLTLGGERMPVTIEFYYDDVNAGTDNPYGAGWSTSYNQLISYNPSTERYCYKDENGTWIYFTDSGEVTDDGKEIWREDTQYGVGEVGVEMYRTATAGRTIYTSVLLVKNEVNYSFDTRGRLVRMSDGSNQIIVSYADNSERIACVTDPVGRQFCFTYSGDYLSSICAKDTDNIVIDGTTITYAMTDGLLTGVTYGDGYEVTYSYDDAGRIVNAVNVDLCGYTFGYTGTSDVVSMVVAKAAMGTDAEVSGSVTMIDRPEENQVLITSEGTQQKYVYDNCGRIVNCELRTVASETSEQTTDSTLFTCVYGYNLTYGYVTNDDGTISNTVTDVQAYDANGAIDDGEEDSTEETVPEETVPEETVFEDYIANVNEYGNVTSEEHIVGEEKQITSYTYDSTNNYISSVTDANGNTDHYEYNSITGLISSLTDACGNRTHYTYNALREVASVSIDVAGLKSNSHTSLLGNGALSMDVSYTYDSGRLSKLTYGDIEYDFIYDVWGNILRVKMDGSTLVAYNYGDEAYKGQVRTLTYGNGQHVYYAYNSLGQVVRVGYNDQLNRFAYSYRSDGTLSSVYDAALNVTTYYTDQGYSTVMGRTDTTNRTMYGYTSDTDGTGYTENVFGNTFAVDVTYEENVTMKTASHTVTGSTFTTTTAYDAFSRLDQKLVNIGGLNISQDYEYRTINGSAGTSVFSYTVDYSGASNQGEFYSSFGYDGNGNIAWMLVDDSTKDSPSVNEYTYDMAGQLTEVYDRENGYYYKYTYDKHGNLLRMESYTLAADGTTTPIEQKTMVYSGSVLQKIYSTVSATRMYTSDAMGNPTQVSSSEGTYTLTWGEGRMLRRVYHNAGNYTAYTYGADGLRAQKYVMKDNVATTTKYAWGPNGLAGYVVGSNIVIVLYDDEGSPIGFTLNDTTYAYVKNMQGDVMHILDGNGNVVVTYAYDPWGVPTVTGDADLAALNPCSYRGYDYDEETGYYYLRSRYYDPKIGRFINADVPGSIILQADKITSANLFVYCLNNPICYADHTGFAVTPANVIGAIIGLIGGTVIGTAIANYFNLKAPWRGLVVASTSVLLTVIGWFSGPAVYAAIRPVVIKAIQAGSLLVNKIATWIQQTLGIIRPFAEKAIKNVSKYCVKTKHLPGSPGTYGKFATADMTTIREWITTALKNGTNFQVNSADSYYVIYNMGRVIGTKGERCIKVVFTIAGKIITAYPLNG